jgi:hypothetical protein
LTANIWSNASLRAFLAVTAHWIGLKDSKLDLKAALIGFHLLKKKHTGRNVAKTILHLTDRAGITKKASVVGHQHAVDYQPHSLGADFSDDDDDDTVPNVEDDDGEEHNINAGHYVDLGPWFEILKRDPVKHARVLVCTVCLSGQRKDDFQKLIKLGNNMGSFKDEQNEVMQLRELQLLKDVRHCWDSLYVMLARLDELHPVRLLYLPSWP